MQQIKVRYENGVFIPLEVFMPEMNEGTIITIGVQEGELKKFRKKAGEFFRERFPGQELSEKVAGLIGILYQGENIPEKSYKEEYREYLWRKYQ